MPSRLQLERFFFLDDVGASGFPLRDVPRSQLTEGVRTVARGDALLLPAITRRLVEEFVRRPRRPEDGVPPELVDLTERALEVTRLVARGLSNAEIARELHLRDATIETYVARRIRHITAVTPPCQPG